jgi:flagellar protein FlgJ
VTATVQVASTLKVRSTPSLAATIVGSVRNNQKVTVSCVTPGTTVRGTVRTSNLWARVGTGRYLSYAYLRQSASIARCAAPNAVPVKTKPVPTSPAYKVGTVRSTDGAVNLRAGASTSSTHKGSLSSGATVHLVCGVVGQKIAGTVRTTNQWNQLTNGTYISHAYVVTPTLTVCKGATAPVPTGPALTPEQFIRAAVPGAQLGWREFKVPPSVTIAQAILESGWGRSKLSATDRNYFGIKCFNGKYGKYANGCHSYVTQECTKAGSCFTTTATFRAYPSMANSFRDHGYFLNVNSRYKPAFAYTTNANKFIWNVWKAGYATDPNYYTKITGIMAKHKLYQYDTWK